jgi:hypothetical protein
MSWYEDFVVFSLTHSSLTFTEVIAPLQTVEYRLFQGSYSWETNYRNGSTVIGNLNLSNSTAIVITGSTVADIAGLSAIILEMSEEINVTVTSTNHQVLTISIDLSNANSTIVNQTISILTSINNSNSSIYDQTISLMAAISNLNSSLYAQTLSLLLSVQNELNATIQSQTLSILNSVSNFNVTLFNQTINILSYIENHNVTMFQQVISILNSVSNQGSTINTQFVEVLNKIQTIPVTRGITKDEMLQMLGLKDYPDADGDGLPDAGLDDVIGEAVQEQQLPVIVVVAMLLIVTLVVMIRIVRGIMPGLLQIIKNARSAGNYEFKG